MTDLTNILGGPWSPSERVADPPDVQLKDAIAAAGLEPPDDIYLDGNLHRFKTGGRKPDKTGWYVAFGDGVPAGRFGCWREGIEQSWRADVGRNLTAAEEMAQTARMSEARRIRDAERQKRQENASDTVAEIWSGAGAASADHPYLARKGIEPHGARITGDGRLIVPLYDDHGHLSSLQYIDSDGDKRYHPGGATGGRFWQLGEVDGTLYVAEGFATAATIREVTHQSVVVAYSASNLVPVVGLMREKYGHTQDIVIVADNDKSDVGRKYADQAAARFGARVVIPPTDGDANDYQQAGHDLLELLKPKATDWLIPADDFSQKPAPIRWLIKHWLQRDALMMMHGPSGSGKTFVALDWMLRLAAGREDWCGHIVRPGPVVYLAGEGHHGLRGRIAAWKHHHGADSLDMWLSGSGCDLNKPDGYLRVSDALRASRISPCVIVVDTLHRFLNGDENSAQDAREMLDACAKLMSEFSCSVLLVHHTGVAEEAQHRARGSSAWKGALDIEISVVSAKNGPVEIIQRKCKDAEVAEPVYCDLQAVEIPGWLDEDGEQVTSAVVVQSESPPEKSSKKDDPVARQFKRFHRAWWATGAEVVDGQPYISRSGLKSWMESEGMKPGSIRNAMAPNGKFGVHMVATLLDAEKIQKSHDGFSVCDNEYSSSLLIMKGKD